MKKLFAAIMLSAFTLSTLVAAANPVMQQDTTKKHKMKKDTSMKKDTTKKPVKGK
jgi:pentapeptide MXKDX repeat protein